jgi:hypothetical protein
LRNCGVFCGPAPQICGKVGHDKPQFKRWLAEKGCVCETGKGGHLKVFYRGRAAVLPVHGSAREPKKGAVEAIKKRLGLK